MCTGTLTRLPLFSIAYGDMAQEIAQYNEMGLGIRGAMKRKCLRLIDCGNQIGNNYTGPTCIMGSNSSSSSSRPLHRYTSYYVAYVGGWMIPICGAPDRCLGET